MSVESQGFINSDNLTKWVKYFLCAQILMALMSIFSNYLEYQYLTDLQSGVYDSDELATMDAEASDFRQRVVALLSTLNFIVSGIVILKWIYRANYNARELGAKHMQFTPGWAIGFYFIPIAMLWKPYQAMKEIWLASEHPKNWKSVHVSAILPLWWTIWLINNFIGHLTIKAILKAKEVGAFKDANILQQISSVFDIALALVFFVVVIRIHENQKKAYMSSIVFEELELPEELESSEEFEIPEVVTKAPEGSPQ